ncbi:MAG: NIL domain-containing protein, partial [Bacillota bacterium]
MKKRVVLDFPSGIVEKPITYHLIKKYDIVINILQARIFPEEEGRLIIELENRHEQKINQGL